MSLELRVAVRGNLREFLSLRVAAAEAGAMAGAREAALTLKTRLRADVLNAGLGQRLANTWRSTVYPERGTSLTPAAIVASKAPHIVRAFEDAGIIRSKDGFFLAIPTDAAPRKGAGGVRVSPSNWPTSGAAQRFGPLRFVPGTKSAGRGGRLGLLVADDLRTRKGKRGGYARASAKAQARGEAATVVMFILVPQVRLRKRLDVAGIAAAMQREYPDILVRAIATEIELVEKRAVLQ